MTETPWLTVQEAAGYARCRPATVRRACVKYQRDSKSGLRSFQRVNRGAHLIHRADLDAWIRNEKPGTGTRKPATAA